MKLFHNKTVIGILCIALGLLVALVLSPLLTSPAGSPQVKALRLKQNVDAGTLLTAQQVESTTVSKDSLPKDALTDAAQLEGRMAASRLYVGDLLTEAKTTTAAVGEDKLAAAAAKGLQVVTVTLPTLASSVAGQIEPGDIVAVLSGAPSEDSTKVGTLGAQPAASTTTTTSSPTPTATATPAPTATEAENPLAIIEVCAVAASDGSEPQVLAMPGDEDNRLPAVVSLYATAEQAQALVELDRAGGLHLVLVARHADAAGVLSDDRRVLTGEVAR